MSDSVKTINNKSNNGPEKHVFFSLHVQSPENSERS